MKVILYQCLTLSGHIGLPSGSCKWVNELDKRYLERNIKKSGIVVMGRRTYETVVEEFPLYNALNVVLTRNKQFHRESSEFLFTDMKPNEIVALAEERGYEELLLVGGRETNTAFLCEGLIDEIKFSVHPIIFCDGMEIFHESSKKIKLELLNMEKMGIGEDLIRLHYKVVSIEG